jgi:hypothetical protein
MLLFMGLCVAAVHGWLKLDTETTLRGTIEPESASKRATFSNSRNDPWVSQWP